MLALCRDRYLNRAPQGKTPETLPLEAWMSFRTVFRDQRCFSQKRETFLRVCEHVLMYHSQFSVLAAHVHLLITISDTRQTPPPAQDHHVRNMMF
jgi:hypothetical protein